MNNVIECFLLVWFLVGIANWASHVLLCAGCKKQLSNNVVFILRGTTFIFGWPFDLWKYYRIWQTEQTKPIHEDRMQEMIFSQEDDESEEAFRKRVATEMANALRDIKTKAMPGQNEEKRK